MEEIAQLVAQYGMGVILLVWMIYKDYKFNENILAVLEKMQTVLARLETWHNAEEAK